MKSFGGNLAVMVHTSIKVVEIMRRNAAVYACNKQNYTKIRWGVISNI